MLGARRRASSRRSLAELTGTASAALLFHTCGRSQNAGFEAKSSYFNNGNNSALLFTKTMCADLPYQKRLSEFHLPSCHMEVIMISPMTTTDNRQSTIIIFTA